MLGCSLFARFSVSTVGLEPSEKTTTKREPPRLYVSGQQAMSLPTEINGIYKMR